MGFLTLKFQRSPVPAKALSILCKDAEAISVDLESSTLHNVKLASLSFCLKPTAGREP
jgi:hypothetical protein